MYRTRISRTVAGVASGTIAALVLAAPAVAGQDQGDVGFAKHGGVELPPDNTRRLLNDIDTPLSEAPPSESVPDTTPVSGDDGSIELLQIALGALGGVALTVGGAAALNGRRRHHPQSA